MTLLTSPTSTIAATDLNSHAFTSHVSAAGVRPRLKQGIFVISREESTYVGKGDAGIEIFAEARIALASFEGVLTCEEIADLHNLTLPEIYELLSVVDDAHLLDTQASKIAVYSRFHSSNTHRASHSSDDANDGAYQQLQMKLAPELTFTTWLASVRDGGVNAIGARRDTRVEIYGDSRIAILIFGILLASGVSSTQIVIKDVRTVGDSDLGANFLSPADIGLPIHERLAGYVRELSLFPIASTTPTAPETKQTIAINVGPIQAERVQGWLSKGVPHLFIDNPDGASITIGPLVLPGTTPCLRCIAIGRDEHNANWRDVSWHLATAVPSEVPVAVAHHVAGLATLEILRFIDEGKSSLIGATDRIEYHNPRGSERINFTRHPACGCNW